MEISVIVPTLNEADRITQTLSRIRAVGSCEILVADGGSDDGTLENAGEADVCLSSPPGRGRQLNAGAAASSGDVLLFLHADCWLDPGSFEAIRRTLSNGRYVGGCFRQVIEANGLRYRLLEWGNTQRVKWWKWAYGDQGIFVRREAFDRVGGFPDLQLMEDLFLTKRIKRVGKLALLDSRIHISARRWQQNGVIRQTLANWTLTAFAQCGVSPNRLARFYPSVR